MLQIPSLKKTVIVLISLVISCLFVFSKLLAFNPKPISTTPTTQPCTFLKWFDPNTNNEEGKSLLKNCSSCHMAYYKEWINDKHSMSQNNPFFLSVYSGTTTENLKSNVYPGFKLDHPEQSGNCALCHNPEAALVDTSKEIDIRTVKNTNGISCDFCHKIESIDQNPLKKGIAGINIVRAIKGNHFISNIQDLELTDPSYCKGFKDIRFGPIKDPLEIKEISDVEKLKYNSLYKTSLVCAKCHDGLNGNVPIYSTFTEWVNSPAARRGVQCQHCHMPPRNNANSIIDNPSIKSKSRPYHQIHSHSFLTEDPHELRKKYVDLKIETKKQNEILTVNIVVENNNFGHSFPTGSPMRNAILLLEVKNKDGKELSLIKGPRLPNYAGNLRQKPGKLFAKILEETSNEYALLSGNGSEGIEFRKKAKDLGIPAQDWWNIFIASDTRIKANESNISVYEFKLPPHNGITITAKLFWRNTWAALAKIKQVELKEDLLIERKLTL